jgi:arylsulfatase A-like enzyme
VRLRARASRIAARGLLGVVALLCGCAQPPDERPSALLVVFDTTRFDHTSLAGYARATTPRLAALAAEGAQFAAAYAPTSTTGPTHATLFTGLSPLRHGVTKNGVPLPGAATTLAERLSAAGYRTGGFVSSFVVSRRFGFDRGFRAYDDAFERESSTFAPEFWEGRKVEEAFDRRGDETTRRALRWLEDEGRRGPFFLFVHYFDPHAPYVPPADFAGRFEPGAAADALARDVAHYDEEIAFADAQLAALLAGLDRLGLAQRTLVTVTADHGEGLMDHGHMEHGVHVYEEQVRVPWVLRWPGRIPAGLSFDTPVALLDLAPTVLELLGVPAPDAGFEGRSLAPALLGRAPVAPAPVYLYRRHFAGEQRGESFVRGEKFGVREGRFKYIDGPEEGTRELFDLEADPQERRNLAAERPETAAALGSLVDAWREGRSEPGGARLQVTPEERERLRALGYTE